MSLASSYNPKEWEPQLTLKWRNLKAGSPEVQKQKQELTEDAVTFSVIMPPPNLTAKLHAGHAMNHYLQDTLARLHRQQGIQTLVFPGVDHAGLQLEGVINKYLASQGIDRTSLSREEFLKVCWDKVTEWRNGQSEQALMMGTSADYDRELFTLDERASKMVEYAFKKYYQDGLIYKNSYVVNWSVGLQTALSDVSGEIEYAERTDPLVTFRYGTSRVEVTNSDDKELMKLAKKIQKALDLAPIMVSTVRPETIFGDVAVAIHPDRLCDLLRPTIKNKELDNVLQAVGNQTILIYQDVPEFKVTARLLVSEKVDPEFGSGALKITPASDIFDYELYTQDFAAFNLPSFIHPIERSGKMSKDVIPTFQGISREEARVQSIALLIKAGYIQRAETPKKVPQEYASIENIEEYNIDWEYVHNVSLCERTKTVIEPLISEEFFLSYHRPTSREGKTLAELGHLGVSQTNFYPVEFRAQADGFLDSIKDWCISRDLVWGHRIPVWYNVDLNPAKQLFAPTQQKITINGQEYDRLQLIRIQNEQPIDEGTWVQETKILDTWFSSSLWPLTTLGFYETNPKIQAIITDINGVFWDENNNERVEVIEFLKQAKEVGICIYYLSNMASREMFDRFVSTQHFSLFDGGVSTYESGQSKDGSAMYEMLLSKYVLDSNKVLYIDDVSEYVQLAKKIGIESVWYTPQTNLFEVFNQITAQKTSDFERYYPTQYMNTAKEIFYLWIVRMIVLGMYFAGQTPFQNVMITPTVLDGAGKKMSKSLGNGLQPEDAIEKFSSDALRLGMLSGVLPNRNMRFGGDVADRIMEKMRNFGNKIWNIGRFLELQREKAENLTHELSSASHWLLQRYVALSEIIHEVQKNYEFVPVIDAIVDFVWNDFADVYVEYLKTDSSQIDFALRFFNQLLVTLHPFLPFETEALAHELYGADTLVWRQLDSRFVDKIDIQKAQEFNKVIALVQTIRSQKGMFGIKPTQVVRGSVTGEGVKTYGTFIESMTRLQISDKTDSMLRMTVDDVEVYLDVVEHIADVYDEIKRSEQTKKKNEGILQGLEGRLANENFLARAEPEAVEQAREDVNRLKTEIENLESKITYLYKVREV